MSDPRQQRDVMRRLEQTQVVERPGGISGQTTFYASGTWTPAFAGSLTAGSYTTPSALGTYTRIGNQVICHGYLRITAIGVAPTGSLWLITLPFTAANTVAVLPAVTFGFIGGIDISASKFMLTGFVRNNTTHIELAEAQDNAAGSLLPAAALTASGELAFSFTYQV